MKNNGKTNDKKSKGYSADTSEMRKAPGYEDAVPGVNTPNIELPAFNPPVPNRAWTAMKNGLDIEELTENEKRDLYMGHDGIL
jgi:hypothetical protein